MIKRLSSYILGWTRNRTLGTPSQRTLLSLPSASSLIPLTTLLRSCAIWEGIELVCTPLNSLHPLYCFTHLSFPPSHSPITIPNFSFLGLPSLSASPFSPTSSSSPPLQSNHPHHPFPLLIPHLIYSYRDYHWMHAQATTMEFDFNF